MSFLLLDVETTGLPSQIRYGVYHDPKQLQHYGSARIVQISWMVCDEQLQPLKHITHIVKPDGFTIPPSAYHKITHDLGVATGIDIKAVLQAFGTDLTASRCIVAHNADFDIRVLASEAARVGEGVLHDALMRKEAYCTMKKSNPLLKLRNRGGYPKDPSLAEFYTFATGKDIENAHDAGADVKSVHEALSAMVKTRAMQLPGPAAGGGEGDSLFVKMLNKKRPRSIAWANALLKDFGVSERSDVDSLFELPSDVVLITKPGFAQLKRLKAC